MDPAIEPGLWAFHIFAPPMETQRLVGFSQSLLLIVHHAFVGDGELAAKRFEV